MYLQPHHLRVVAILEGGVDALLPVCERALNGDLPPRAAQWLYSQKVVPLSKMSHHQADIEARVKAAAAGKADEYVAPVRPIVIGDALLRLAEKTACKQEAKTFRAHLMPYQVGVAVPGGLNMWATVVECLLQVDPRNVIVAVDLENMFNAIDRDELVEELLRHPNLAGLARNVIATYPPGLVSVAKIEGEWRRLSTERGLAQGRCLSPVLASVLLQPCIIAAEEAMVAEMGCTVAEFRATAGVAAYLDDMTIVAHPRVAAVGLRAFQAAVSSRGWRVNLDKTVCGVGYYEEDAAAKARLHAEAVGIFDGVLRADMVQVDGQVLLGTPLGADSASVHVGGAGYRQRKLADMVDAHDVRLRSVVGLARRSGMKGTSTQRISIQLSQLLLRWCCNTRNVHLLRGLPRRIVGVSAARHDQGVKVACAASLGLVDAEQLAAVTYLHQVPDAALTEEFVRAYAQVRLDVGVGGHSMRSWGQFADAAFVGQWALTVQSARVSANHVGSHYPILDRVVADAAAHDANPAGVVCAMPIVVDLALAWKNSVAATRRAVALRLPSHNKKVVSLGLWLTDTGADLANLLKMPPQAQRELSATIVSLNVHEFHGELAVSTHWDARRRLVNWLASQGSVAGRWATVVPWDRQGHLNLTNTNYLLAFCRRYRLERPRRLRGPDGKCACGHRAGGMCAGFDGDHDECDCPKRQWAKSLVHHTIVDALCRFLKDCGFDAYVYGACIVRHCLTSLATPT